MLNPQFRNSSTPTNASRKRREFRLRAAEVERIYPKKKALALRLRLQIADLRYD
jgi:hypothetical protein